MGKATGLRWGVALLLFSAVVEASTDTSPSEPTTPSAAAILPATATPPAVATPPDNPEAMAPAAAPAPVHFRDRDLFQISQPLGRLLPRQRAAAIEARLLAIAGGPATALDAMHVTESDGLSELYAGDTLIRAVTDQDAQATGLTRQQLAAEQLLIVRQALQVEFRDRSIAHVLRGLALAAGATVLLLVSLWGLRRMQRWIHGRINRAAQNWHWRSGLARLKLLSPAGLARSSRSVSTLATLLIGVLLAGAYLEFVLSLFPWTRGIAAQMTDAVGRAVVHVFAEVFGYVPELLNIIVIVLVARLLLKVLKGLFEQVQTGNLTLSGFYADWAAPTYAIVRFFVIAVATVMVFPYLPGSGSAGFKGVATFLGLALSFGGAPAIGNVISGTIITYMRPFAVGDRVKIADAVGDVVAKNLLVVRLRTIKNVEISIPNALVLANHIVNFSARAESDGLILHTCVSIGYAVPWKTVHELLIRAARRVEGVLAEPAPFVLQTALNDFYVSYEINAYTREANEQATLYARLHEEIQDSFAQAGVEILSPHYSAIRDGNALGLPEEHLPKDYRAPGFGVLARILRPDRDR